MIEEAISEDFIVLKEFVASRCECGQKSEHGYHGVRDGEVYSEYYCHKCYNEKTYDR